MGSDCYICPNPPYGRFPCLVWRGPELPTADKMAAGPAGHVATRRAPTSLATASPDSLPSAPSCPYGHAANSSLLVTRAGSRTIAGKFANAIAARVAHSIRSCKIYDRKLPMLWATRALPNMVGRRKRLRRLYSQYGGISLSLNPSHSPP